LVQQFACDKALRDRIDALVKQLGADDFATRERASRELHGLKKVAYTELQQHRAKAKDPEVKASLDRILRGTGAAAK
jgi:hypothetical protein